MKGRVSEKIKKALDKIKERTSRGGNDRPVGDPTRWRRQSPTRLMISNNQPNEKWWELGPNLIFELVIHSWRKKFR